MCLRMLWREPASMFGFSTGTTRAEALFPPHRPFHATDDRAAGHDHAGKFIVMGRRDVGELQERFDRVLAPPAVEIPQCVSALPATVQRADARTRQKSVRKAREPLD